MRVLHLYDAGRAPGPSAALALLADACQPMPGIQQAVIVSGPTPFHDAARRLGLRPGPLTQFISPPLRSLFLGMPAVRRHIQMLERSPCDGGSNGFDAIHCWSIGGLTLASLLRSRVPRVLTVTRPPTPSETHWLAKLVSSCPGTVLLPVSAAIRRTLLTAGVPESAVHVLAPSVDFARLSRVDRSAVRAQWLIDPPLSPRVKVVALLDDPPGSTDCSKALLALGLAWESLPMSADRPQVRLLVHSGQRNRRRVINGYRHLDPSYQLIADERLAQPWEVLPACDAALTMGPRAGGLPLLWAMAAGLPLVAEATYAISEFLENGHSALLAKPDQHIALAHRLSQVLSDAGLAWKLRDTARHEAFSYFSRQRFAQNLAQVYLQVVERQPVEVPPMPVTGGLRFSPRP